MTGTIHAQLIAKGSTGGRSGGFGGGKSSSTSKSSGSTGKSSGKSSSTSNSTTGTTSKSTSGSRTAATKTTTKKPASLQGKQYSNGHIVDDTYRPSFAGGYAPPVGSAVYYPQASFTDWLPWYFLFTQNNANSREAVVVQPDGKQVTTKEEGFDGMVILEWIFLLAIIAALVGLAWWGFKKFTQRKESYV